MGEHTVCMSVGTGVGAHPWSLEGEGLGEVCKYLLDLPFSFTDLMLCQIQSLGILQLDDAIGSSW